MQILQFNHESHKKTGEFWKQTKGQIETAYGGRELELEAKKDLAHRVLQLVREEDAKTATALVTFMYETVHVAPRAFPGAASEYYRRLGLGLVRGKQLAANDATCQEIMTRIRRFRQCKR